MLLMPGIHVRILNRQYQQGGGLKVVHILNARYQGAALCGIMHTGPHPRVLEVVEAKDELLAVSRAMLVLDVIESMPVGMQR